MNNINNIPKIKIDYLIKSLQKKKVFEKPLSNKNIIELDFILANADRMPVQRFVISRIKTMKKREVMIRTADLDKVESYAYMRFYNYLNSENEEPLSVKQVCSEIGTYYKLKNPKRLEKKVKSMRKKASYDFKKIKKLNISF